MKNQIGIGETLDLAAPYARLSGEGAKVGSLFGVACTDIANGVVGAFKVAGVFSINKLSTDVVAAGDKLYWDDTNKRLTTTSAGNSYVGVAVAAAGSGVAVVSTKLNGFI